MHGGSTTVSKVLTKLLHTRAHTHTPFHAPHRQHIYKSPLKPPTPPSHPLEVDGLASCSLRTEEKPTFRTFSYQEEAWGLGSRSMTRHCPCLRLRPARHLSPASLIFPSYWITPHSTPTVLLSSVLTENKREKQKKRSCWPPSLSSCHLFS